MGALATIAAALTRAALGTPLDLPPELVRRYPELADARWRRGGIPPRVAGWALRSRGAAAITLWRTVFLAPGMPLAAELLLHELRHVHQFGASRAFPMLYLLESLRHGYSRNRYEADAREWAARRLRARTPSPTSEGA
jgi:hypothetical protein